MRNPNILSFSNEDELEQKLSEISKDALFFLDVDIGTQKDAGVELSKKLNHLGYENIYLTTGHSPESFLELNFLKGV